MRFETYITSTLRLKWQQGIAMRQFQSISHLEEIAHPTCVKCGAPMWLTRIERDEPGSARHTFECQACQNEVIEVVKSP
jgi:hypothetical protein